MAVGSSCRRAHHGHAGVAPRVRRGPGTVTDPIILAVEIALNVKKRPLRRTPSHVKAIYRSRRPAIARRSAR